MAMRQGVVRMSNKALKQAAKMVRRQLQHMLASTVEDKNPATFDKPYLSESGGVLALNFDGLSVQSEMFIDAPDDLVIGYTRAMMSFLLLKPSPRCIAMIGLGGGSLAKYCYRYLPDAAIEVIEINADVIALRNEFAIPPDDARFRVLLGDGAGWVRDMQQAQDVLIVDGFDAQGLPDALSSQRFYDDCYASLADDGIMVVNLWGGYPNYASYLARINNSFDYRVVVVDADDSVNKIVLAMKDRTFPPPMSGIRHHANLLELTHPMNFQAKANKLLRAFSSHEKS